MRLQVARLRLYRSLCFFMELHLRTIIYIDGFNFYYGCVRKTSYKWLDLKALFQSMLNDKSDKYEIIGIKYFTAQVRDLLASKRQETYIKALKAHIPEIKIEYGYFLKSKKPLKNSSPIPKFKEKGSDVNLSVCMLNDAWLNKYDCAVLVTNDGDMAGALRLIKEYHPKKERWLMTPAFTKPKRKTSSALRPYINDNNYRRIERENLLKKCQLPNPIQDTESGELIYKPDTW